MPIQLIETKRLSAGENLWLRSLTGDLESETARYTESGEGCGARVAVERLSGRVATSEPAGIFGGMDYGKWYEDF